MILHRLFQTSACMLALGLSGCMLQKVDPNAKAATTIDPKLADSQYWFDLPTKEVVKAADYDKLWNSCETTATDFGFAIDRFDYRTGYLTTKPLISKQFFELWKADIVDFQSQADSDTATHRRVAHFKIHKLTDGGYVCEVKVVVEHYCMSERRITAVYQYRDAFSVRRQFEESAADDGTPLRIEYWYAERRDAALEHVLADRLRGYVDGSIKSMRMVVRSE